MKQFPFYLAKCECNQEGSENGNTCDVQTGVCTCKGAWSGDNCQGKHLSPHTNNGKDLKSATM